MVCFGKRWSCAFAIAGLATASFATRGTTAYARSGGMDGGGCGGCHGDGSFNLQVTTSPSELAPGQSATIIVRITSTTGSVTGLYVEPDAGAMQTIAGQGTALTSVGLTHTTPKLIDNSTSEFRFTWTSPGQPGAVRFEVHAVVANGNGASSGDASNDGVFDFVYGCEPQTYYRDADGDGYGDPAYPLVHCAGATPPGYSTNGDDCDDYRSDVHPGAVEYCNNRDDNCNGEIDEDAIPVLQYPDADGDGYFGVAELQSGESFLGCVPTQGWAAEPGDCAPFDPDVHPGAEEICNMIDDNCNGRIDEYVRPRCGEGWCRREAPTCDPSSCVPGEPREYETCNFFDDDCDGQIDNDAQCEDELVCVAGECRAGDPSKPTIEPEDDAGEPSVDEDPASDGMAADDTELTFVPASSCRITPLKPAAKWLWFLVLLGFHRRRRAASSAADERIAE